jgi:hypothetical protein
MLSQSEVNQLVAREKQNAAAKARQEVEQQYQQQMEQRNQSQQQQPQMQQQMQQPQQYGQRESEAEAIYQKVQEKINQDNERMAAEMQERQFKTHMSEVADKYYGKLELGRTAYPDFDTVTEAFDPTQFGQLVYLLADNPDAHHILYDLANNPSKLVTLDALAKSAPEMAKREMAKLGGSINHNDEARRTAEQNPTKAPLDHMRPSRVSGSSGDMSVSDFMNDPRFRG